jgi:hypothetical protein
MVEQSPLMMTIYNEQQPSPSEVLLLIRLAHWPTGCS